MIEEILPHSALAEEMYEDPVGATLFPEELLALGRSVQKRRREFATARLCARRALERLGLPPQPIPVGERGEPIWPAGVVGSITHCSGYRACAVARAGDLLAIGIDAEPNAALPVGVLEQIAGAGELSWLRSQIDVRPDVSWDRLLFSAKESVYKVWFPLARCWLGFEDATVTINPNEGTFVVRLLVAGPLLPDGRRLATLPGRWVVRGGLVLTAIALAPPEISTCSH